MVKDKKAVSWQKTQYFDYPAVGINKVDVCKGHWSGKYNGVAPIEQPLPSQFFARACVARDNVSSNTVSSNTRPSNTGSPDTVSPDTVPLDTMAPNAQRLWANAAVRPEINIDRYRSRVRQKYGLASASRVQVAKLSQLERALSQSNAGLRQQLAQLTAALDRSDALCASESATRVALDEKFSQLLKSLPIGVVELDSYGVVKMTNPAADLIVGQSVIGRPWFDVVKETFKPQADDGYEISTVNGKRISVVTQSLDDRAGQLILLNDQTDTRQLQSRLAHSDRLAALGRTAATLAHQVRTPVCGALLYLSQVSQDQTLPAQTRERVHKAVGRLEHLERQVKQILMLARGEVVTSDKVSTVEFIAAIKAALAPIASQTDVKIHLCEHIDSAPNMTINQEALVGCVMNVVENAVLACGQQGHISITVDTMDHAELGNALRIVVADDGPGMDAAALASATIPFFTARADGTGLGLSMVKMVMQAHGGCLDLASVLGGGTQVTLALPLPKLPTVQTAVMQKTHQE